MGALRAVQPQSLPLLRLAQAMGSQLRALAAAEPLQQAACPTNPSGPLPEAIAAGRRPSGGSGESSSSSSSWLRPAAASACGGLCLAATTSSSRAEAAADPPASQGFSLLPLEQRRRAMFKYEKKIREMSPAEKVFEYFASEKSGHGGFYMNAGDMMRSVVPVYPPEGSDVIRAGSLPGEPNPHVPTEDSEFLRQFDTSNDGKVSFEEYLLFQTLLSISLADIEVAFALVDADGSGAIDASEFGVLLSSLRSRAARPSASLRKSVHSGESEAPAGLLASFFGKDGRRTLSLFQFTKFQSELQTELVRLEFAFYDWRKQGSISGRDFANSVVGCARLKHVDQYLDKVAAMPPELAAARISLQHFEQFRAVWRQLRLLSAALEFTHNTTGNVGPAEFQTAVSRVLKTQIPGEVVSILFYLFSDKSGKLNVKYMYEVMNRHHSTGLNIPYEFNNVGGGGGGSGGGSVFDCIKQCYAKQ